MIAAAPIALLAFFVLELMTLMADHASATSSSHGLFRAS